MQTKVLLIGLAAVVLATRALTAATRAAELARCEKELDARAATMSKDALFTARVRRHALKTSEAPRRLSIKDRVFVWGYMLDSVPTECPFVFWRTRCSLENGADDLGAERLVYMNSMFNREYVRTAFPYWSAECCSNCVDNRLSPAHLARLGRFGTVYCALEHHNQVESGLRIARLSLDHPNIAGINIDDFNIVHTNGLDFWTMDGLRNFRAELLAINPKLKIMAVSYSSNSPQYVDMSPSRGLVDIYSRWCWKVSPDYWKDYRADIAKLRAQVGPEPKIVQGIYINDFGSSMQSREPVPMDVFQLSVRTICEGIRDGIVDGLIVPQTGWFDSPKHREHVIWLRNYLDGFDAAPARD